MSTCAHCAGDRGGERMNARTAHIVNEEVGRLQAQLANNHQGYKVRAIASVTRLLLLRGPYMYNGRQHTPKAKTIGAGVYEIWLEEEKP